MERSWLRLLVPILAVAFAVYLLNGRQAREPVSFEPATESATERLTEPFVDPLDGAFEQPVAEPREEPGGEARSDPQGETADASSRRPPKIPAGRIPPPESQRTLSRLAVDARLADRAALEAALVDSVGEHDGYRLLKLERVASGSLYALLELLPRDLLLAVDGEWITRSHNPLFDALAERSDVTLVYVRRGISYTVRYIIE